MKTLGRGLLTLFILLGLSSWLVGQDNFKIRVGVVTYETFQDKDGELRALISKLSGCLLYTSPSPRDLSTSRMPSSA